MTAFATVGDVAARLSEALDTGDFLRVGEYLEDASDDIRAASGQTIYPNVVGGIVTLQGNGRRLLQLPQVPVTAVASVVIDGVTQTVDVDYRWNAKGMLQRLGGCWPFLPVVVTYSYGYAAAPDPIRRLCAKLTAERFQTSSGSIQQESVAGYSVTYRDPEQIKAVYGDILDAYMPTNLP